MHLLQSGIDISVIALWLGHESPATTHMYLQADLAIKERTLNRLQPMTASQGRYRPPDQLMQYAQFTSWKSFGKPMVIRSCLGELRIIIGCA
ncbi:hypothetical protein [Mesorhizobium sp.]|uniref:hypothetical protein n=1 Tax=Mesorhizobium sp. TaxID=1871066 RepID=UPI00257EF1A0|nr:hypothetical protein [Mesorhizobium sp.]